MLHDYFHSMDLSFVCCFEKLPCFESFRASLVEHIQTGILQICRQKILGIIHSQRSFRLQLETQNISPDERMKTDNHQIKTHSLTENEINQTTYGQISTCVKYETIIIVAKAVNFAAVNDTHVIESNFCELLQIFVHRSYTTVAVGKCAIEHFPRLSVVGSNTVPIFFPYFSRISSRNRPDEDCWQTCFIWGNRSFFFGKYISFWYPWCDAICRGASCRWTIHILSSVCTKLWHCIQETHPDVCTCHRGSVA